MYVCVCGQGENTNFIHTEFHTLSACLSDAGKSYTMIGRHDSLQTLGIIPCAISWLFKLINERREKTGARFSVRVSAVEVSVAPGSMSACLGSFPLGYQLRGHRTKMAALDTLPGVNLEGKAKCAIFQRKLDSSLSERDKLFLWVLLDDIRNTTNMHTDYF